MPAETKPKRKIELAPRHRLMDDFSVLIHDRQAQIAHETGQATLVYRTSSFKNLSIYSK